MKKLFLLLLFVPIVSFGQTTQLKTNLPFSEISEYPTEFSQANIVSRMIEGLGYRYYWATKSLTEKDLNYKPSDDTRSTLQILEHIYSLTEMISSSFKKSSKQSIKFVPLIGSPPIPIHVDWPIPFTEVCATAS